MLECLPSLWRREQRCPRRMHLCNWVGFVSLNRLGHMNVGKFNDMRHSINLNTAILEPDVYWDREGLDALYTRVCKYYSMLSLDYCSITFMQIKYCRSPIANLSNQRSIGLLWAYCGNCRSIAQSSSEHSTRMAHYLAYCCWGLLFGLKLPLCTN